ncbi:hypothetical protein DLJ47_23595 [Micromonospora sp. S4605]|nr:hypothetical protein DLJ47_23595 [Micromonospora sp. S4605]
MVQAARYQEQGLTECTLHLGPEHYGSARRDEVAAVVTRELQANGFPVTGSSVGDWSPKVGITLRLPPMSESQRQRAIATEGVIRQLEVEQKSSNARTAVLVVVVLVLLLASCAICGVVQG